MASEAPLVSVSMLTHNHEKYIAEAIHSVLCQSLADFELVIVDDGSTDRTPQIIASIDDPRIVPIRQPNQGPSAAANRAYRACRGRYIALMSGDDVCHSDRLERQLSEYRRGKTRMLFSAVDLIDDDSRPLTQPTHLDGIFAALPTGRAEIYHRFFHRGNFINAITGFTETKVMQTHGLCDPCLLQLQDYDQWIRLVKRYEICFLPEPTLSYRIRAGGQNLSAPEASRLVRHTNEMYFIMRRFFDDVSPEFFRVAFREELLRPECTHPLAPRCEQALLLVRSLTAPHQLAGMDKLQELLEDPETAAVLRSEYQFDVLSFNQMCGKLSVFHSMTDNFSTLYFDTGTGFNERDTCRARANLLSRQFDIAFDLNPTPTVQRLRWDPYEGRLGQVQVEEIVWQAPNGRQGKVDVSTVAANGVRDDAGVFTFETPDPAIAFPFTGPLSRLRVRGSWDMQPPEAMRTRYMSLLSERDALRTELAMRQAELTDCATQLHGILASRRWKLANKIHSIGRLLRGRRAA